MHLCREIFRKQTLAFPGQPREHGVERPDSRATYGVGKFSVSLQFIRVRFSYAIVIRFRLKPSSSECEGAFIVVKYKAINNYSI